MAKSSTRHHRAGPLDVEILRSAVLLSLHANPRHLPAGADPLPVGVPSSTAVYGGANAEGNAEVFARQNHVHACTRQFFVPYNAKIADITETDAEPNRHTLTLANPAGTGAIAGETRKIIAVQLGNERIVGTGFLNFYPNEGTYFVTNYQIYRTGIPIWIVIKDGTQRLQYSLGVANDDWDLFCYSYVVES